MGRKVCRTPGCPTIINADAYRGLCDDCRRSYDRARGTRAERGYDTAHDAERETYAIRIRSGETLRCVTCNKKLSLNFHMGHTADRKGWIGPQCPFCNDSEAGKASHTT